ncbi:MAG TPA: hypothetical protein VMU54_16350 [Planctomycetota bacterium]|nr:hypothetical protein [Planctomycetota bacterium]
MVIALFALLLPASGLQDDQDKTATQFAQAIAAGFKSGDAAALDRAIDVDAMADRALVGMDAKEDWKRGFRKGVKETFSLGKAIAQSIQDKGSYTFLRFRTVDGKRRAMFRLVAGGSYNYHDCLVEPAADGFRIVDIYIYTTGEWMSASLRRMALGALAQEPGTLGKLVGRENEYVKFLPQIQTMTALHNQGKNAEALKIYEGLPASVKKEKNALVVRIAVASAVSVPEWTKAVDDLKKAYPGDPCLAIQSIALLIVAKKFDEAAKGYEDLDQAIGGDAYLHCRKADVWFTKGDLAKARESAEKAVEIDPAYAEGYWIQVTIGLKEKRWTDVSAILTRIEKDLRLSISDLSRAKVYAEYVTTPEYEAWMKSRGK